MKNATQMILQLSFLLFISIPRVSADSHQSFLQCLLLHADNSTAISEIIYTPKNSSYDSILNFYVQNLRFTAKDVPKPQFIITPVHESQIQTAIYCSRKYGLQMRIRSGGHDFEGSSYISQVPFFILDLFNFRSIEIDLKTQTAWVGSGATLGETYYSIYQKNRSLGFPAGYWPTVAIGGHISGGGYGPLVRKYGLAADNVLDARIIDVNGRILDRKSMGEDLFWAIRGGVGANFGVILGYKLKLVEVPEKVTAFIVRRNLEQNATKLVLKWQNIAPKLPVELLLSLHLARINSNQETAKGSTIEARFVSVFHGGVNELLQLTDKYFPELGLVKRDCVKIDWIQYYAFHLGQPIENTVHLLTSRVPPLKPYFKGKGDFVQKPIPEKGLKKIWDLFFKLDPNLAEMEWTPYGGIMDKISESEIPFPHRAGNSFIAFEAVYWNGTEDDTKIINERLTWMKEFHNLIGKYVADNPRGAYADYRDLDLGINEIDGKTSIEKARIWGAPYFKNNFDRLVKVKTMVDPSNFFRNEQSIPPLISE